MNQNQQGISYVKCVANGRNRQENLEVTNLTGSNGKKGENEAEDHNHLENSEAAAPTVQNGKEPNPLENFKIRPEIEIPEQLREGRNPVMMFWERLLITKVVRTRGWEEMRDGVHRVEQ